MRYYFTFLAVFLFAATGLQAQFSLWEKLGNNVYNSNLGGQVGIGTPFPTERLDIFGNAKVSGGFSALGNVGIGLTNPAHKLSVAGDINFNNNVLMSHYENDNDIDHIWHADGFNTWVFTSDRTKRGSGNSFLEAGAVSMTVASLNNYFAGNVGIGVTNPIQKLSVGGDINLNNNVLMSHYENDNDIDHIWHIEAFNTWAFVSDEAKGALGNSHLYAGNVTMVGGDNYFAGNVGIGTNSPNYPLDVNGAIGVGSNIQLNHSGSGNRNSYIDFHSSDASSDYSARIIRTPGENAAFLIQNRGSGSIKFAMNGTDRMFLSENGNLGIGLSNPLQKLSVDGDINLNGNVLMMDYTNANDVDYIVHNDLYNIWAFTSDASVGNTLANGALFAGNVNMSGGNNYFTGDVEIGDGPGTGMAALHVNGGFIGAGTYPTPNDPRINTRFSDGDMVLDVRSQIGSGNQQFGFFPDVLGSAQSGHQFLNGEDTYPWTYTFSEHFRAASAGNYGTYSDKRLKSNIEPIENGLDIISKLSPKIYDKNVNLVVAPSRQHKGNFIKDEPGFIAQEVEKILPQLVHTSEKGEQYKSLGMMGIIPYVVAAVNELKTEKDKEIEQKDKQLEAQKAEIKDLNSRVEKLEKALSILLEKEESTTAQTKTILLEGEQKTYLKQNRPNPFKGQTIIEHQIPNEVQKAELSISTLDGKMLKTILLDTRGIGQTIIETRHMAKGEYVYTLILDGKIFESKTMILMH